MGLAVPCKAVLPQVLLGMGPVLPAVGPTWGSLCRASLLMHLFTITVHGKAGNITPQQ